MMEDLIKSGTVEVSPNFKPLEHIRLNSTLYVNFACEYGEDGKIFILSECGVYVLTLKGYPSSVFPRLSLKKDIVKVSDTAICDYIDTDITTFTNDVSRQHFYEALLDVRLSGNLLDTTPLAGKAVYAKWSPRGIVEKTEGAIAVLTTLSNIEIFVEVIDENELTKYTQVANFAKDISDYYKKIWRKIEGDDPDQKMLEYKNRVDFITPTTFTWSHVILKDRKACCVLFVGHNDGSISAWRFVERKANEFHESKLEFLDRYNTKLGKISALHWFCRKSDAGGLSIGDHEGKISALSVSKLSTDKICFCDEVVFNNEPDLKVDQITIVQHQEFTYLIAIKQKYLLAYAINNTGEVIEGKLVQVGNLYLTGILYYEKNILLGLSVCGQVIQIELSVNNKNGIDIKQTEISLDLDSNRFRTHGFVISPSKVFLCVLTYPCRLKGVHKGKGYIDCNIYYNTSKDPLNILMNTNSNSIRDYWDCFEVLRVKCIQEKKFPWVGLDPNLNYDRLPLLKLKILRWIAKMSESILPKIARVEEYNIKAYVLLNYAVDIKCAVQRMTQLLNLYFSEKKLSLFQMRSLDLLNFFLKEMVAKEVLAKANLGEVFIDEMYEVIKMANELEYPPMPQCLWCGERLIGSSCVPFHPDSRCAISLNQISIIPGFKCPFCKCVVSKEMGLEYYPIFCPYCDVPMKRRCFERRYGKKAEDILDIKETDYKDEVTSDCSADCLKEDTPSFNDIDENPAEFVVLTDSEDETDERNKALYQRIKAVVLSNRMNYAVENPENVGEEEEEEAGGEEMECQPGGSGLGHSLDESDEDSDDSDSS